MICVLSFCQNDREMALELARHIHCLGGVKQHDCLMLHPSDVFAKDIAQLLYESFGSLQTLAYQPRLNGWPDGPNQCFEEAAEAVFRIAGDAPWLWLEADCVPTRPEWLNEIARERHLCGKPILGAFESTFGLDGNVAGQHVTGVAVYPHDWWKICPPLRTLTTATETYRAQGSCPPAFDVYLAPYSVPNCATGMAMRHYWKSHSYVERDGAVTCEYKSPYGASNVIDMSAALIHGCKDYSLLNIVQNRLCAAISV